MCVRGGQSCVRGAVANPGAIAPLLLAHNVAARHGERLAARALGRRVIDAKVDAAHDWDEGKNAAAARAGLVAVLGDSPGGAAVHHEHSGGAPAAHAAAALIGAGRGVEGGLCIGARGASVRDLWAGRLVVGLGLELRGVVSVPAAVLAQLQARAGAYPVPWEPSESAVAWLLPARLLLYVDGGEALRRAGLALSATLDGAALSVQECWSCRTGRQDKCFQGYWMDLTGRVTAGTEHALALTLPPLPVGDFLGVFYDHVDTVYASA